MDVKCFSGSAALSDGVLVLRPKFVVGKAENRIQVAAIARIEHRPPSFMTRGSVAFHSASGAAVDLDDYQDPHVLQYVKKERPAIEAFIAAVEHARSGDGQHSAP